MTTYTKSTDFAAKDALLTGNPSKVVKGTEIDTEFTAIAAADATSLKSGGALGTPSSGNVTNLTGTAHQWHCGCNNPYHWGFYCYHNRIGDLCLIWNNLRPTVAQLRLAA